MKTLLITKQRMVINDGFKKEMRVEVIIFCLISIIQGSVAICAHKNDIMGV